MTSPSQEKDDEHLKTLEAVLQRLMDYNLRVNEAKCKFFQEEITYCRHKIDANGLHKTQDKIEAVINAPKIVNEYDQEIPQSQTADNPVAP